MIITVFVIDPFMTAFVAVMLFILIAAIAKGFWSPLLQGTGYNFVKYRKNGGRSAMEQHPADGSMEFH